MDRKFNPSNDPVPYYSLYDAERVIQTVTSLQNFYHNKGKIIKKVFDFDLK